MKQSIAFALLTLACASFASGCCSKAASSISAAASDPDVSGRWTCMYSNKIGSVSESLIVAREGSSARVSASGYDSATRSSYGGSGRGTYQSAQLDATLTWTNGATPTWFKLRPSSDGRTMTGRRGKFGKENAKYEGDYNCTRT